MLNTVIEIFICQEEIKPTHQRSSQAGGFQFESMQWAKVWEYQKHLILIYVCGALTHPWP